VADVAVTTSSLDSYTGEAMTNGRSVRRLLCLMHQRLVAMAVGEALTNLAAAHIN